MCGTGMWGARWAERRREDKKGPPALCIVRKLVLLLSDLLSALLRTVASKD